MAATDPASPRQLAYLKQLAYSRGVSFFPPTNRLQASRLIDQSNSGSAPRPSRS